MKCTRCGGRLEVRDSRNPDGISVNARRRAKRIAPPGENVYRWRRRVCVDCSQAFETIELIVPKRAAEPAEQAK